MTHPPDRQAKNSGEWAQGPGQRSPTGLVIQFTVTRRNKAQVTDIIYIRTWQGWLYLAVVMDRFLDVGWSAGPAIRRELVLDALSLES